MAANYLYIAKTKPGEFAALSHLKGSHKRHVMPLFDLSRVRDGLAKFKYVADLNQAYINDVCEQISEFWCGRTALIDAMRWDPSAVLKSGQHVISYFYDRLSTLGVHVIPVLGYDRWESAPYRKALQSLDLPQDQLVCLRLETEAIKDSAEPEFFRAQVESMVSDIDVSPRNCLALIDFEDITAASVELLLDRSAQAVEALKGIGFNRYATAGCSMPPSIELAVPDKNSTGKVIRKEWLLWQAMRATYPQYSWLFGDYGIRGPKSADDVPNPHTNGKIRYTTNGMYFVARGHSMMKDNKGAQMHDLAMTVQKSKYFMDAAFSWGDAELIACAMKELRGKKPFKGNQSTWIGIDTNHHLTWVGQEVAEVVSREVRATYIES